jgi:hypothetical protein
MVWAIIPWAAALGRRRGAHVTWCMRRPAGGLPVHAGDFGSLGVYGTRAGRAGAPTTSTRCWAGSAPARRWSRTRSRWVCRSIPVLLLAGNVTLRTVVNQQAEMHLWNVLSLSVAFVTFLMWRRSPRRIACRSTCRRRSRNSITGYHTEYSGDEVLAVHDRGVREHGDGQSAMIGDAVLRRVGRALHAVGQRRAVYGGQDTGDAGHDGGEDRFLHLPLHVDPLDAAALPLRPADVPGLEHHAAVGPRLHRGHCQRDPGTRHARRGARPDVLPRAAGSQRRHHSRAVGLARPRQTHQPRQRPRGAHGPGATPGAGTRPNPAPTDGAPPAVTPASLSLQAGD